MKKTLYLAFSSILIFGLSSCKDDAKPNYQFFPNMYESVAYETYTNSEAFANGIEAQNPVEGTIARGWKPYDYLDTNKGYEEAKINLKSPLENTEFNKAIGKELYGIYCATCHGSKGDGQGVLTIREKFLGIPSYADREITEGSIYHVIMYGRNLMGSHAGQINEKERWQVTQYVMELRVKLFE